MTAVPDTLISIKASTAERLTLYSSRGITQTLQPIDGSKSQRETINGQRVDLSLARFRKYSSRLSCSDQRPPALDDIWPGRIVIVDCAYLLSYPTSGGSATRSVVSGSSFTEGNFTFYRPEITFMIEGHSGSFAEWEAGYDWSIDLKEVSAP